MNSNQLNNHQPHPHKQILLFSICLLIDLTLLSLFVELPAFASPEPGAVSMCTDISFTGDSDEYDSSNPTAGRIIGVGCTEFNYTQEGYDEVWTTTTITGPDGSSQTFTSNHDAYFTTAQVSLDGQNTGRYTVSSVHWVVDCFGNNELYGNTSTYADSTGSQDVYYKLAEQVGPVGNGTIDCYYDVCNDYRNNICNRSSFRIRQTIQFEGNCAEFIRVTWVKYRIPFIGITWCSRSFPVRIPWNPCPNG